MIERREHAAERAGAAGVEIGKDGQFRARLEEHRAVGIDGEGRDLRLQALDGAIEEREAAKPQARLVLPHAGRQAARKNYARYRLHRCHRSFPPEPPPI
nr:hypothetical protein [Roseateles sp. XES5]